jgi:hypothetical protein
MTLRRAIVASALPVVLVACSGGGDATEAVVVAPAESVAPGAGASTTAVEDGTIEISVEVGVDSGADRIEEVALGSIVRITVVNDEEDDEVHLHGYDLGGEMVEAGEPTVFEFEASTAGEFEVESHVTGEVLMILVVR